MVRLPVWFVVVLALAVVIGFAVPAQAAETTKGKCKSISADKNEFVLTDANGKDWTFHLADNAKIRLADKDIKLNEMKAGDMVEVTYEKKDNRLIATEVRAERK